MEIKQNIGMEEYVKVTRMNHLIEVQYLSHTNGKCPILNLGNGEYVNKITGEIGEYAEHEQNRLSHIKLYRTFKKLRYLINNNFTGSKRELMITVTYRGAEPMTNPERLYNDSRKFIQKLRRYVNSNLKSTFEYISVVEPQRSGSLHSHIPY